MLDENICWWTDLYLIHNSIDLIDYFTFNVDDWHLYRLKNLYKIYEIFVNENQMK